MTEEELREIEDWTDCACAELPKKFERLIAALRAEREVKPCGTCRDERNPKKVECFYCRLWFCDNETHGTGSCAARHFGDHTIKRATDDTVNTLHAKLEAAEAVLAAARAEALPSDARNRIAKALLSLGLWPSTAQDGADAVLASLKVRP